MKARDQDVDGRIFCFILGAYRTVLVYQVCS